MQFWLPIVAVELDQIAEVARCAERRGYAGVTLADHVVVPVRYASRHPSGDTPFDHRAEFPDPLTTIAAMSAVTTKLEFLTYVYVATMREPFSLAKQAGTVAGLSGNRLRLGLGAGWLLEEIQLLGFDPHTRGQRMDEMVDVMRRFWRDGVVEFHGTFYDFDPVGMFPQPRNPVPIWIGGKSPAALRRAAQNDGWVGMNYDIEEIPGLLAQLTEERTKVSAERRSRMPFEMLVTANAAPSAELYSQLESLGVTSTVALAWPFGDPAFAPLERKLTAIEEFADRYLSVAP
jgi:probable F420-dependent oxidoreductase